MFKQINLIVIIKTFMEPLMWLSLAIHYEDAPRFSGRLDSWLLLVGWVGFILSSFAGYIH